MGHHLTRQKTLCGYDIHADMVMPYHIRFSYLHSTITKCCCQGVFANFQKLFYFPRKLVNRPFADEVRLVVTLFPLANGICANSHRNRKIRLCELGGLPYALDERAVSFVALNFHFRPPTSLLRFGLSLCPYLLRGLCVLQAFSLQACQ